MYVGHVLKVAESDSTKPRVILPAPSVTSVSEPPKGDGPRKRRVLPRGLFPQAPKAKAKCVEILSQSGLHNPTVSQIHLSLNVFKIYILR